MGTVEITWFIESYLHQMQKNGLWGGVGSIYWWNSKWIGKTCQNKWSLWSNLWFCVAEWLELQRFHDVVVQTFRPFHLQKWNYSYFTLDHHPVSYKRQLDQTGRPKTLAPTIFTWNLSQIIQHLAVSSLQNTINGKTWSLDQNQLQKYVLDFFTTTGPSFSDRMQYASGWSYR